MNRAYPLVAAGLLFGAAACGEYEEPPKLQRDQPAVIVETKGPWSEYNPAFFSSDYYLGTLTLKQCLPECHEFIVEVDNETFVEYENLIGTEVVPDQL